METKNSLPKKSKYDKNPLNQLNNWVDQVLFQQQPILPQQQQQQQPQQYPVLRSRWFRLIVLVYILFSFLLTAAHFSSWLSKKHKAHDSNVIIKNSDKALYQRTYDKNEAYSLISSMPHGLKMSKLFSQGQYNALKHIQPFWLKSSAVPAHSDVTLITTITADTWSDFVLLAKEYNGPISATLRISSSIRKLNIEAEYKSTPQLHQNVDIHLVNANPTIDVLIPLNVERNLARIYAVSDHVVDLPLNTVLATGLRETLVKHQNEFAKMMARGDMLVIPAFMATGGEGQMIVPQTKKELVGLVEIEKSLGLFDGHFDLNDGPTDFNTWKKARSPYKVTKYTMQYEPIVIQSKTVQPWCSERFIDKRSACLLSSYLAGNEFYVLPNDFVVLKPIPDEKKTIISDLDVVIEKRLYSKFYWEQCVHQSRQLDALGLWDTLKSEHIRQQCSRIIQNWGKGLIGKP